MVGNDSCETSKTEVEESKLVDRIDMQGRNGPFLGTSLMRRSR